MLASSEVMYGKENNASQLITDIIPELAESEDERIRKGLIDYLKADMEHNPSQYPQFYDRAIAYLERQKEPKLLNNEKYQTVPIETLDRLYASEKELKEIKQKEQKPLSPEDKVKHPLYVEGFEAGKEVGRQCERVFGEQKPAEKQDYSGLTEFERAIHRGFLCAGVENVPVTIIKETAHDCLAKVKPAEWSDEDEKKRQKVIRLLEDANKNWLVMQGSLPFGELISWLKSLRPQKLDASKLENYDPVEVLNRIKKEWPAAWEKVVWKPSKEQMKALNHFVDFHSRQYNTSGTRWPDYEAFQSLQTDLLKLK